MNYSAFGHSGYDSLDSDIQRVQRGVFDGTLSLTSEDTGVDGDERVAWKPPIISVDDRALASFTRSRLGLHDEENRQRYREWYENRLFRHGFSNDEKWELYGDRLNAPAHRQYYHPNIARPAVNQHINLIGAHTYHVVCRSPSYDLNDEIRAEQANLVLRYQDRVDDPQFMRRVMLDYAADCSGLSFVKLRWDPQGGDVVGYEDDGFGPVPVFEGMVRSSVLAPWQVCWDPDAVWSVDGDTGLENCEWFACRHYISEAQFRRLFTPEERSRFHGGGMSPIEGDYDALWLLNSPQARRRSTRQQARLVTNRYCYVEYYQRRDPDNFRAGLYVRLLNGCVMSASAAPFAQWDLRGAWDIPVVGYNHAPVFGRFHGVAPMDLVRDIQRAVNVSESSRLEAEIAASYRKIFIMGVDKLKGGFRTEHAQVFCLPAQAKVQQMDMPPPKADEHATMMIGKTVIADLTAVHDVSRGAQDTEKTATETSTLRDADQTASEGHVRLLNRAHAAVARGKLFLAGKLYTLPRQLKITGDDDSMAVQVFQGTQLDGFADVEIVSDGYLPAGREARLNALSQLITIGQATGERPILSQRQILDAVNFKPGLYGAVERTRKIARAEAVNLLQTGMLPEFWPGQDHQTRVEVWQDIIETPTFRLAPPPLKQAFQQMLDLRLQAAQAQAAMALAAGPMGPTAGTTPGGGADKKTTRKEGPPA